MKNQKAAMEEIQSLASEIQTRKAQKAVKAQAQTSFAATAAKALLWQIKLRQQLLPPWKSNPIQSQLYPEALTALKDLRGILQEDLQLTTA